MRIVNHVDEDVWRAFVAGHPDANIFHTPEMRRVFARTRGYEPGVWATLGADDDLLALFLPVQITVMDRPGLRWMTTRSVVYGSVLCAPTPAGQEALNQLLRRYNQAMRHRLLFTELRNLSDMSALQPVLCENGLAHEAHLNFLIDLTQPKTALWDGIRSSARRNVRKARKSGVVVEAVADQAGVTAAYTVLQTVYKRLQVPLPDLSLFQSAFEILHPPGMMQVVLARVDETVIGAMTLLFYKGVVLYWYTGALREYSAYRANDLLVWHALEMGCENGLHTFDFGGGGKPDEAYGVRDFKAKFGGTLVDYGRNTRVHAPLRLSVSQAGYGLLRRYL